MKNNLHKVRRNLKIRQWDIALQTGIPQSKLSLVENGYIGLGRDEEEAVADALGVDVSEVFLDKKMKFRPDAMRTLCKPDIIGVLEREGIELRRSGRNYFALCPFHAERTPSFCVDSERQTFGCYGCGKSGDVITFIRELKGLSFPDTLKYLGIEEGEPKKIDTEEVRKRGLVRAFRQWCREHYDYLCSEYRTYSGMMTYIRTPKNFIVYSPIFEQISNIEHQLDILWCGIDEDKYRLFRETTGGF